MARNKRSVITPLTHNLCDQWRSHVRAPEEGLKGESSGKGAQAHLAPPLDLPLCATNMLIPDGMCKFIAQTDVTPY
jgi:hypothetical protein